MTVSSTINKIIYPGNGATTSFPFTFSFPGGTATQEAANIQVYFTDLLGNITLLAQGSGATNYQITFNAPTGTNPTPSGGTVTYNPSGTPIPSGTSLTILRALPLVQATSLANQGTLYQPVEEAALDYEMMVSQQVLEVQSRALIVSVSDPVPGVIPAVAARKNLFLAFDSSGNPIASQPGGSNTPISSSMVPVVTAATLGAARTALGLGTIATESIGLGLQDNGAGAVQTYHQVVADSTNQTVTSAFHEQVRAATGAVTYTLPLSSTLFNGFGFFVDSLSGGVNFVPNAADAFVGMTTGAAFSIPAGSRIFVVTDGAGKWYPHFNLLSGNNAAVNMQINATVAASALTIALKDSFGNDPSPASPIIVPVNLAGVIVVRAITTPLSIVVPQNATIGTTNGQANRLWLAVFDNAGSPVLGVYNTLSGNNIVPWDETVAVSGTAISGGSTSAQTWYTNGGVTTKAFRILGYIESTQPTAGQWTVGPSKIQIFGPGIRKPGEVVQYKYGSGSGTTSINGSNIQTTVTVAIAPTSPCNLISVNALGNVNVPASGNCTLFLTRSAATPVISGPYNIQSGTSAAQTQVGLFGFDVPNTTASTSYFIYGTTIAGTHSFNASGNTLPITAQEIQI
jgi:hypothetical protein